MFWLGSDTNCTTVRLGTLALTRPLLDRLRLADTIDHLAPADPQQEYSQTIRLQDRPRRILEVLGLDSPRACLQTHLPIHQSG